MARLSAADKWPSEIRELVGRLRAKGATIDAIRDKLRELDIDIPRSTLGREIKGLDEVIANIRAGREIAEAIGTRLDDATAGSVARANVEILQALTTKLLLASNASGDDGAVTLGAKDAKAYSEVLRNLASASKVDLDREIRLREELKARLDASLAQAEEDAAGGQADAVTLLKRIRQDVYGICDAP